MFAAVCMDGSYAQKVYFAKLRERPKVAVNRGIRCRIAAFVLQSLMDLQFVE